MFKSDCLCFTLAGAVLALKRSRAQAILRVWLLNSSCLLKETSVYVPPKRARLRNKVARLKPLHQDLELPLHIGLVMTPITSPIKN